MDNQIDCLADLGRALGNLSGRLWEMRNGYALATSDGLKEINNKIKSATESDIDELRELLRIGIQWDTEVTLGNVKHTFTQVYCSALPVAYSSLPSELWAGFAKLVLEAAYEATICAGILNYRRSGNNKVFLTLVGGGAFGNDMGWIINAISRSLKLYRNCTLDVAVVSYRYPNPYVQNLIRLFQ